MDDRGQVLLLPERRGDDATALQGAGDHAIEHRRGQLDRVARQHARVEPPEPALVLGHHVIAHAEALRLPEGGIGDLVHADRARRGTVHLERVPRHLPAPVGAGHRVARALDLGERGEQLGGDGGGRVAAEERRVAAPGLGGRLGERAAHREEQLARLADHLVRPVHRRPDDHERDREHHEAHRERRREQEPARATQAAAERAQPRAQASEPRPAHPGLPGRAAGGSGAGDRGHAFDSTPRGVPSNPYPGGIAGPRDAILGDRRK